jgi:hypothetical protein
MRCWWFAFFTNTSLWADFNCQLSPVILTYVCSILFSFFPFFPLFKLFFLVIFI